MNKITHGTVADLPPSLEFLGAASPWLVVLAILVISYLLARLVKWSGTALLKRSDRAEGDPSFQKAVLEELHAPLYLSIVVAGLYLSLIVLDMVESSVLLVNLLVSVFVLVWTWFAIRLGTRWLEVIRAGGTEYKFAPMLKNLWKITALVGAGLLLVSVWNLRITPFLASAGILGIILGFAAQDTIANLIGGIALYFDETYKVGDVILLEDGLRGTVIDVGIRSTTVLTQDNVTVSVPNSLLNTSQVVNQSIPRRQTRMRIPVSVAYGTDYTEVEQILIDACEASSLVMDTPQPKVLLSEFADSAIEFELRAFVVHPLREKEATNQIYRFTYDAFDEAEIVIPFPQRMISYLDDGSDRSDANRGPIPEGPDGGSNDDIGSAADKSERLGGDSE